MPKPTPYTKLMPASRNGIPKTRTATRTAVPAPAIAHQCGFTLSPASNPNNTRIGSAAARARVQHAPVGRAEKRAGEREASRISAVRLAHPHDAAEIVDVVGAAGPSAEGSQVDDAGPLRPQKRVAASAHDLPSVVDSQ